MRVTCSIFLLAVTIALPATFARASDPAAVNVERNLVFASPGGQNLKLNLYRPANFSGKLPVVVLIYGGAWMMRNPWREIPRAASAGAITFYMAA